MKILGAGLYRLVRHRRRAVMSALLRGNLLAVSLLCGVAVLASPASASVITYDVEGLVSGGGALKGNFSIDASTFAVTNVALTVTGTSTYAGQIFGNIDQLNGFTTSNNLGTVNNGNTAGLTVGELEALSSQSGGADLHLSFLYPQGPIVTTTSSQFGESSYFVSGDPRSESITGSVMISTPVSAVPLPATLPMFGAALLGLGAVGFGMKRRSRTTLPA